MNSGCDSPPIWAVACTSLIAALVVIIAQPAAAQPGWVLSHQMISHTEAGFATQTGIGLGSAIAVVCSWQRNRSIFWAILAGILSWLYVIYFAVTREVDETK